MFVTKAPLFSAEPVQGGEPVSVADILKRGPAVLAFFKVSCPTCQLAFPFLERLHAAAAAGGGEGLQFVGISQDDAVPTTRFNTQFGVTFPVLLDRASSGYAASNAYGLTHVPAIFVLEPDGKISHQWTGFSRADFEKLAGRLHTAAFGPADSHVPAWKAG